MKTTSRQSDLATEPMARSIWVLLAMAVIAVAAPTASDAQPLATCKAMCQRLTDCKMSSYTKTCLDTCKQYGYEASEQGRAQLLTLTRYSCKQIQSAMAGTDRHQHQRASTRPPSTRPASNDDAGELDKIDKELNDFERQLGNDAEELERRSRGPRAPARGAGGSARGRSPAQSGSSHWTCNAEGLSVYGFDVESGGGDVRGRSTVSIPGSGSSKDEAAYQAMSACGSLMTTNLSTDRSMVLEASSEGQWGVRIEAPCHVTRCAPM